MKKVIISALVAFVFMPVVVNAQTSLNENIANAVVVRDPARQSSTEIDAVVYNPAGTAFLDDGFHFSLNGIGVFQTLEGMSGNGNDHLKNIMPSFQAAYKRNNWTFSFSWANEGGYGQWKNRNGSGFLNHIMKESEVFDSDLAEINTLFSETIQLLSTAAIGTEILNGGVNPFPLLNVSADDMYKPVSKNLRSKLYNFTSRLGASYLLNEKWSAYLGVKLNYVVYHTKLDGDLCMYRPSTGESWTCPEYFESIAQAIECGRENLSEDLKEIWEDWPLDGYRALGRFEPNVLIRFKKENWLGVAPVIGLDYHFNKVNIGAKYEFKSVVHTNKNFEDFDLPANLSLGVDWQIDKHWNVAAGGTLYFNHLNDNFGKNGSGKSKSYTGDVSTSLSYSPCKRWLFSVGETYSRSNELMNTGIAEDAISSIYSRLKTSLGVQYDIVSNLQVNVGLSCITAKYKRECLTRGFFNGFEYPTYFAKSEIKPQVAVAVGLNYSF